MADPNSANILIASGTKLDTTDDKSLRSDPSGICFSIYLINEVINNFF